MPDKPSPIPGDQPPITPYLAVAKGVDAIEFYRRAFGATELIRLTDPDGRVGHAELEIGGGRVMLSDEYPEMEVRGPASLGGSSVTIHVYVADVDAACDRAVAAGATVLRPVADQFYGDRGGKLLDPFGHVWWLASRIESVSPAEMKRRADALFGGGTDT
ncbi:MAG: VOC family protein [Gemmatimonadota bacterium]